MLFLILLIFCSFEVDLIKTLQKDSENLIFPIGRAKSHLVKKQLSLRALIPNRSTLDLRCF